MNSRRGQAKAAENQAGGGQKPNPGRFEAAKVRPKREFVQQPFRCLAERKPRGTSIAWPAIDGQALGQKLR